MTLVRVQAGPSADLTQGVVRAVQLPRGTDKRPREALLVLGSDGKPRAYLNRCRHLPIPIDSGSRRFLNIERTHLLCGTHGALYRFDDGMCVEGPCTHMALEALFVDEQDGELFVLCAP